MGLFHYATDVMIISIGMNFLPKGITEGYIVIHVGIGFIYNIIQMKTVINIVFEAKE
jgi:hypothetical protein